MKIILFILIPFIMFGQYINKIPCTDNAASTVVTNNGSGANWVASVNTSTIYSALNGGQFLLNANTEHIKSADNWVEEKVTITFSLDLVSATAVAVELHFGLGDGNASITANEFWLYRTAASDEWYFRGKGAAVDGIKSTTDFTGDTNLHDYKLIIDATKSPWEVDLYVDNVKLSWGAWSANPDVATFNSLIFYGETGNLEPDAGVQNITMRKTVERTQFPRFTQFSKFEGF
jgi:hypothetical protein